MKKRTFDVDIRPIKTSKDKIKQPELAKKENGMLIPPLGSSVIISGKSGSGKSTLLANLLLDKRFYKGWFDKIFLFSPTADGDDIQKSLNIPAQRVFTDLDEAPEMLEAIIKSQKKAIAAKSADKVRQYAIIFDDVIGDTKFMNSKTFAQCFYQVRHVCCTTFICTQHFKRVPRVCRLQANFIFYFRGSQSELQTLVEEFSPPWMSKDDFAEQVVFRATSEDYSFLTINMKVPWAGRFRRNLGEPIETGGDFFSAPHSRKEEEKEKVPPQPYAADTRGKQTAWGGTANPPQQAFAGAGKRFDGRLGGAGR